MQALPKSQLLRFVEQAYHSARRAVARYSSTFSKRRYTLHQHIVLLWLKVRKNTTHRTLLDELTECRATLYRGHIGGRRRFGSPTKSPHQVLIRPNHSLGGSHSSSNTTG